MPMAGRGTRRTSRVLAGALAFGLGAAVAFSPAAGQDTDKAPAGRIAVVLDIDGPIGPAVSDYVARGIDKAKTRGAVLVILRMDTPGGLDSAMREIIRAILGAPMPVVTFVPSGARAASAGTYIAYASPIAAMAPGANIGAATPVQLGGAPFPGTDRKPAEKPPNKPGGQSGGTPAHPTMEDKVMNDAVAYIRSLAQMHGRNAAWAEKAVREAASLTAEDAKAKGVIDLVARDLDDLLTKLDGRTVTIGGQVRTIDTAGVRIVRLAPDWRSQVLGVITNPTVAYLLLMVGFYGLIFEFLSPGLVAPGVFGAISLLVGLYALHMLPVSYAGLALTVLGLGLMAAEAFLPSFGVIGIGGLAAFVIGSIMLIDTDIPGFGISWPVIAAFAAASAGFFILVITFVLRARRRAVVSGIEQMVGSDGRVIDWNGTEGHVRIQGEIWAARADRAFATDTKVRVRRLDGLTLEVESATEGSPPA